MYVVVINVAALTVAALIVFYSPGLLGSTAIPKSLRYMNVRRHGAV